MVYKLKPLELALEFEDRTYQLGDTIDIELSLAPNGDVDVREGRVDLVCEEVYASSEGGIVGISSGAIQGGNIFKSTDYVPMSSWVSQRTESYVHSSVVFLADTTLRSGSSGTYSVKLPIQRQPPTHVDEARDLHRDAESSWSFKWRLMASVDIVRGRNPKRQRTVKVALPQAPIEGGVGDKAGMSTRKAGSIGQARRQRRARR